MTSTSTVNGDTFKANFVNYYSKKQILISAISDKAKESGDNAQSNLDEGRLVINQNTTFNGEATFVSQSDEDSIVIKNGAISFTRDGVPITVLRNMKIGSIVTDSLGSGMVTFNNFKNINILTSIKSFNITDRIRSLNAYAVQTDIYTNTWQFFLYGTESQVGELKNYIHNFTTWKSSFNLSFATLSQGELLFYPSLSGYFYDIDAQHSESPTRWADYGSTFDALCKIETINSNGTKVIYESNLSIRIPIKIVWAGSRRRLYLDGNPKMLVNMHLSELYDKEIDTTVYVSLTDVCLNVSGSLILTWFTVDGPLEEPHGVKKKVTSGLSLASGKFELTYGKEVLKAIAGSGEVQYIVMEV